MVHLAFTSPMEGRHQEVEGEAFILRGGQLERQPQAEPVAYAISGCWEAETGRFARVDCPDRVMCLFEEDGSVGEKHGPFPDLAVADGTLRSGGKLIATLRGSYWQSAKTRRSWPRVRLVAIT